MCRINPSFFDYKPRERGPTAVATDVWAGFIFINLDPQPAESLDDFLGELGAGLRGYPFIKMSLAENLRH